MNTKTKKEYEAPQLTTVDFKMERGYAASGEGVGASRSSYENDEGNNQNWF